MKRLVLNVLTISAVFLLGSGLSAPCRTAEASDEPAPAQAAADAPRSSEKPPPPAADGSFAPDQLEQLVAPIALYPDALLLQILMASTYPLEVVEADRFMKDNPGLEGEALDEALKAQDWDPSVKSLCTLPDVLKQMSENLDWSQDLGDAFLAQKNDVMDTVQKMRGLAYEAGNLETTEQQAVSKQENDIIVIESQDPEVVYVPSYSSTVVYGSSWGYPYWYYPPMYYPPPPGYGLISFGVGVIIGGAIWGNCNWGWGDTDINIDIDRFNEFNRNTSIDSDRTRIDARDGQARWQHDSAHRKGVNYRSQDVARDFGAAQGSTRVTRDQARGRADRATSTLPAGGGQALNRDVARPGGGISESRPDTAMPRATDTRPASSRDRSSRTTAYSGSRSPSMDRMSSSRGASSRGTRSYGGMRGGGAMRAGRRPR